MPKLFSTLQKFWYSLYIVINFVSNSPKIKSFWLHKHRPENGFLTFSPLKKRLNEISRSSPLPLFLLLFAPSIWKSQKSWITEMYHLAKPFIIRQAIISKITESYEINSQIPDNPDEVDDYTPMTLMTLMTLMTMKFKRHKS